MQISIKALWLILLTGLFLGLTQPALSGAETRNANAVLNGMRLKRWTKDLQLNEDQQKKIQVLLDEEGKKIAKLDEDASLSPTARSEKIRELHDETYGKMKPLLDAKQLDTFEKSLTKAKKPKKG